MEAQKQWAWVLPAIVAFLLGVGLGALIGNRGDIPYPSLPATEYKDSGKDGTPSPTTSSDSKSNSPNSATVKRSGADSALEGYRVRVEDQKAGKGVAFTEITVPDNAWITIYEDRDGAPGNILGARRFRPDGDRDNITMELLRGTSSGNRYYVVVHADNGDSIFDRVADVPRGGSPEISVVAVFTAL